MCYVSVVWSRSTKGSRTRAMPTVGEGVGAGVAAGTEADDSLERLQFQPKK